jgi:hypothetical protein
MGRLIEKNGSYDSLKAVWKKLGFKGQVKNFSSKRLWVIENDAVGKPIARWLDPGFKTPINIDVDAFKRVDKKAIDGHKSWWKIYDFSTAEIFDKGASLRVSAITKTAVAEKHFGEPVYKAESWGSPIQLVLDVKRDKKKNVLAFQLSIDDWVGFEETLKMTCHHKIDNARPVFPLAGRPYIRTRRDRELLNNLSAKVKA